MLDPLAAFVPGRVSSHMTGPRDTSIIVSPGIVFEGLNGTALSYKIRLRHEVGGADSWRTDLAAPAFELPGPRIQNL